MVAGIDSIFAEAKAISREGGSGSCVLYHTSPFGHCLACRHCINGHSTAAEHEDAHQSDLKQSMSVKRLGPLQHQEQTLIVLLLGQLLQ